MVVGIIMLLNSTQRSFRFLVLMGVNLSPYGLLNCWDKRISLGSRLMKLNN